MTINLVFTTNREVFRLKIVGKEIFYSDRKWSSEVRLIPRDEKFIMKVKMSRNRLPSHIIEMFNLTKSEKEEYDAAEDEEALATICITDARKKGAKLLKKEVI